MIFVPIDELAELCWRGVTMLWNAGMKERIEKLLLKFIKYNFLYNFI